MHTFCLCLQCTIHNTHDISHTTSKKGLTKSRSAVQWVSPQQMRAKVKSISAKYKASKLIFVLMHFSLATELHLLFRLLTLPAGYSVVQKGDSPNGSSEGGTTVASLLSKPLHCCMFAASALHKLFPLLQTLGTITW